MIRSRRNWKAIGGIVIFGGVLCDGAAMGQNAPLGQSPGNTFGAQNATVGQTADAPTNQTAKNAVTPSTRVLVAQAAGAGAGAAVQSAATAEGQLQEVVVTATHFATAANQTPLSLSTETVTQLNEQGINSFNNLIGTVPSVQITASQTSDLANVAIRGVVQTSGAATTGFYLDNAPLQAFNNTGPSTAAGNGTPLPPIFDLQRVEVLEGPQGTLFGASSEGGTIRYITSQPSLNDWHVYAKLDAGQTEHADGSNYSGGIAVGGPIIPDVLGFRASVYTAHQAGWIQMEDANTQDIINRGMNRSDTQEFQGALLWKPTDNFSAEASFFSSYYFTPYGSPPNSTFDYSEPYSIVEPELGFNTTGATPATPDKSPKPVCVGAAACAAYTGIITYIRPGATTGPYSLAPFTVMGGSTSDTAPTSQSINIPSLDMTWNFSRFTVQLFSSYVRAVGQQSLANAAGSNNPVNDVQEGPNFIPSGMTFNPSNPAQSVYGISSWFNERNLWAEDLRFNSIQGPTQLGAGRLSWTAGLYYQDEWDNLSNTNNFPPGVLDALQEYYYGISEVDRFGLDAVPYAGTAGQQPYLAESVSLTQEKLSDTDVAVYAEGNYNITDHLQATLGLRESLVGYSFWDLHYGPIVGIDVPTFANGGESTESVSQRAFTPKGELTYRFTDNKMVYALVDEGFRPGGANPPLAANLCAQGIATYGLTVNDFPLAYGSDNDWNYELGTKLGLAGGRAQFNADVYRLLWSNVQTTQSPTGCGTAFTTNAAHATSEGFELSGQAIVIKGLALNASFGYDHAYYTENAIAVHGAPGYPNLVVAVTGEDFPIAPWTADIGARLDLASAFGMGGNYHPYVRADWTEVGSYNLSEYPLIGYDPDINHVPSIPLLNVRAGVDMGPIDIDIYALNATESLAGIGVGGRTGCQDAACDTYTSRTPFLGVTPANLPRTIGLQFTYSD